MRSVSLTTCITLASSIFHYNPIFLWLVLWHQGVMGHVRMRLVLWPRITFRHIGLLSLSWCSNRYHELYRLSFPWLWKGEIVCDVWCPMSMSHILSCVGGRTWCRRHADGQSFCDLSLDTGAGLHCQLSSEGATPKSGTDPPNANRAPSRPRTCPNPIRCFSHQQWDTYNDHGGLGRV